MPKEIMRHLTFSQKQDRRLVHQRVAKGDLIPIRRGCYVEAEYLLGRSAPWDRARIVMVARIMSVARSRAKSIVIGAAATMLHGIPRVNAVHDIDIIVPANTISRYRVDLRPVTFKGREVTAGCRIVFHTRTPPHAKTQTIGTATVLQLEEAVVSELLLCTGERGFVAACMGLRRISMFTRKVEEASKYREVAARKRLLGHVAGLPRGARGRARATWMLKRADAACESVAEARLLYILLKAGMHGVRTQHHVAYPGGNYYLDFAIPEVLLAIEFDGAVKYKESPETTLLTQQEREATLTSRGWVVVRFRWADLNNPPQVIAKIRSSLTRAGRAL